MTEKFVLDASVAAKWFLEDEHGTEEATKVLRSLLAGEMHLDAPVLLQYEFANLLVKAYRRLECSVDFALATEALGLFHQYPVVYRSLTNQALSESLEFAAHTGCSVYESCYLWLARHLGCRLLTADTRFVRNLPIEITRNYVHVTGDLYR